jgi:hypothetical protein
MRKAHRVAWELTHGPAAPELFVCHKCDNPPCCNPAHLFLGSPADNVVDMVRKGRNNALRGEQHKRAKLCRADVAEIRALYATGQYTQRQLGDAFGVSNGQVSSVVRGEAWTR